VIQYTQLGHITTMPLCDLIVYIVSRKAKESWKYSNNQTWTGGWHIDEYHRCYTNDRIWLQLIAFTSVGNSTTNTFLISCICSIHFYSHSPIWPCRQKLPATLTITGQASRTCRRGLLFYIDNVVMWPNCIYCITVLIYCCLLTVHKLIFHVNYECERYVGVMWSIVSWSCLSNMWTY